MNNSAIHYTSRLAALHRADVATQIATQRASQRIRNTTEQTATAQTASHRAGWTSWVPAPRPGH